MHSTRSADFDFILPPELIAQHPAATREGSRLMVLHRETQRWEHSHFREIASFLRPGDLLVLNDSRVIPARLRGIRSGTGGAFEIPLLEPAGDLTWWCLARPGKSLRRGTKLLFVCSSTRSSSEPSQLTAEVIDINEEGHRKLRFAGTTDVLKAAEEMGEIPLPPYITRGDPREMADDRERYQTVYARENGSVAAPTAGLHFQPETFSKLKSQGVEIAFVTLHVGLGTFAPVKAMSVAEHVMHQERYHISGATAVAVNRAKSEGRRIIAVGTTSARVLESAARNQAHTSTQLISATHDARTRLFLYPPATFRVIDGLLTNFHLPQSTLLMLVSAFAAPAGTDGRAFVLRAYAEAIRERYRFFSYGDAMLLL